jgi:hypothetical protein
MLRTIAAFARDHAETKSDAAGDWTIASDKLDHVYAQAERLYWDLMDDRSHGNDALEFDQESFEDPERRLLTDIAHNLNMPAEGMPATMRFSFDIPLGHVVTAAGLRLLEEDVATGRLEWSNLPVECVALDDQAALRKLARPMLEALLHDTLEEELHRLASGSHGIFWPGDRRRVRSLPQSFDDAGLRNPDDGDEIPF